MGQEKNNYRTQKGYDLQQHHTITRSMEDYLEMIYRLTRQEEYLRVTTLANKLNVKTSSASKMVSNLKINRLVDFEKYGLIRLTEKGIQLGEYLLYRHNILNRFFCFINQSEDELEQIEQIEHFITEKTIHNMERILKEHNL